MDTNLPPVDTSTTRKIVEIGAKPGMGGEMRAALFGLEAATRLEPGCRAFTFYQALSSPERFLLIEDFTSQAALEAHLKAPYTQAFFALGLAADIRPIDKDWLR